MRVRLLTALLIKRSYERINNLNFFENVELVPKPQPEEKVVDVDVKVKERPTGFFSVGGGYSSVEKFIAMVELSQGNLFGKGQYIKLRGSSAAEQLIMNFPTKTPGSWINPYHSRPIYTRPQKSILTTIKKPQDSVSPLARGFPNTGSGISATTLRTPRYLTSPTTHRAS